MILRTLISLAFIFLLTISSYGQEPKLHVIIFVATEDNVLGRHLNKTADLIMNWVDDIETFSSIKKIERYYFTGSQFTKSKLERVIRDFSTNPNDAIVFWYAGHGRNSRDYQSPDVLFLPSNPINEQDKLDHSINLTTIYDQLCKKANFVWMIGDACNAGLDKSIFGEEDQEKNPNFIDINVMGVKDAVTPDHQIAKRDPVKDYADLFFGHPEQFLFYLKQGDLAYSSYDRGALYSNIFLQTLTEKINNQSFSSTLAFLNTLDKRYEAFLTEVIQRKAPPSYSIKAEKNTGFVTRIVQYLFEGREVKRIKKQYKQSLESNSLESLGSVLPSASGSGKESQTFVSYMKDRPTAYYMTLGIFREYTAESRADSAFVGECYCTASEVMNQGLNTDKEFQLLRKISKYNEANGDPLGMESTGGRIKWLKEKCKTYQKYLAEERITINRGQKMLQERRGQAEERIDTLQQNRVALLDSIDHLETAINEYRKTVIQTKTDWAGEQKEITYTINNLLLSYDEECLKQTILKLMNDTALEEDCEKVFAQHIRMQFKPNDGRNVHAFRQAAITGYMLGQHCSDDIQKTTRQYLQPLIEAINRVPESYRNKLKVGVQVTGYADSKPCYNCRIKGTHTRSYTYRNNNDEQKIFTTVSGRTQRINNEQLAFTRALCSQNEIEQLLNEFGIIDIKYEFIAQVHNTSSPLLRGVSLAFELENQFLYYKDSVEGLEAEQQELSYALEQQEQQVKQLEFQILQMENLLEAIEKRINVVNRQLFVIDQEMLAMTYSGLQDNLVSILIARGYTRQEAQAFLEL